VKSSFRLIPVSFSIDMTILVFAPHADDEVLGVGGTIARHAADGENIILAVLTGSGDGDHPIWPKSLWEVIRHECIESSKILGIEEVIFENLPAACLDSTASWQINKAIECILQKVQPCTVYVPFFHDLHKDHAAIAYGVHVATRSYLKSASSIQKILAYETLSETHVAPPYPGFAFQPNVFVNIDATIDLKIRAMKAYESQLQPDGLPRSLSTIQALATFRGANIATSAAEAFMLIGDYWR